MFFMHLSVFENFAFWTTILAMACGAIWVVRQKRMLLRIPVMILSSPIALLGVLLIGFQVLTLGCDSYSAPLYSPNHDKLVRIVTLDGGALGGNSAVELLTHHGFSSSYIYRGWWGSVDVKNIRWLDDEHITIQYDPYQFSDCTSTNSVNVRCFENQLLIPTATLKSPNGNAVAELHTAKDSTYQGTDAVIITGKVGYAFVYVGDPNSVVWAQTHWLNDHELEITTKTNVTPKACSNQIGITVTCIPDIQK